MKFFKIIIGILILLVGLSLLTKKDDNSEKETVRIGVSTILSGSWAGLGENIVKASEIAVDQINDEYNFDFELVVQDAGLDSKTGLSAVQKLVNTDQIDYIIGGTTSNGTLAAAPLVNEKKIIYMTPVTGGTNVDEAGDYIFRVANADIIAGVDLAHAVNALGYKNVAIVSEITEYTTDIADSFSKDITEGGGTIVLDERFQPETKDFRTVVSKIKNINPEAVLVLSQTGVAGAHFVKHLQEQELDIPLFSDFTFISNGDALSIVDSFEGVYFADPAYDSESSEYKEFISKYEERFEQSPLIPFHAASTYDSLMMLAKAVDAVGNDHEKVHNWLLKNIKDWNGLMGDYSLDEKGNSDLGFVIKQIVGGEAVIADLN